jgi:Tfp pilus assembly protein PilF
MFKHNSGLDPHTATFLGPMTELPAFFSARRLAAARASAPGVPDGAVRLSVRADGQLARGDIGGARAAMIEAVSAAPAAAGLHLQLASVHELLSERDEAQASYRRVLQLEPNNLVALNNLAYGLATYSAEAAEALPLARRAAALAPQSGAILDTLTWTEHLVGDGRAAARHIADAVRLAPGNAGLHLHAAIINAALGVRRLAEMELAEALRLNPRLAETEPVQQLRIQLQSLGSQP